MSYRPNHSMMRVRNATKRTLEYIARQRDWKVVEAAERAAKALAKQEGIKVPGSVTTPDSSG